MTERLSQLIHDEMLQLDIPAPAAAASINQGRRLRRRNRTTTGLAVLATVAVLGGGAVTVAEFTGGGSERPPIATTGPGSYAGGGAFSVGSTVHFGDTGDYSVKIDGKVKSLYYSKSGVIVRSGNSEFIEGGGSSNYALIRPDGSVKALPIELGDRVPSADVETQFFAFAEPTDDGDSATWNLRVLDVETGKYVADLPLEGKFTWGGWDAPPVTLAGDVLYVGFNQGVVGVNWRTGQPAGEIAPQATIPTIGGDHVITYENREIRIVDVSSQEVLLEVPSDRLSAPYINLSPNGRYARVVRQMSDAELPDEQVGEDVGFEIYDLTTGEKAIINRPSYEIGWTPDGHFLEVTEHQVKVCEPMTDKCVTTKGDFGKGSVKLGGSSYES